MTNRLLSTLLPTLLLVAAATPSAAEEDRYLATAEGLALFFTGQQLVGSPVVLAIVRQPANGSLSGTLGGAFVYTPDPDFVGVDQFGLEVITGPQTPGGAEVDVFMTVSPARMPVAGDWNGDAATELGHYDSDEMELFLYEKNIPNTPWFGYVPAGAGPGWRPFGGDWDGDGFDEIGFYDPSTGVFHLFLLPPDPVPPEVGFNLLVPYIAVPGSPLGAGEIPIAGDWSGDGGEDGIGLFVPGPPAEFYLWQDLDDFPFETSFIVTAPGTDPVASDWDGDGMETVGLYDPATGDFYLLKDHVQGPGDQIRTVIGAGGLERLPVAGHWFKDGNPKASIGLCDATVPVIALYDEGPRWLIDPVVEVYPSPPPPRPVGWKGD